MRTVLCVSSDKDWLFALSPTLAQGGFEILTCQEQEAAKALLAYYPIDFAIVDLQLSTHAGLDGLRLIHHISTYFPKIQTLAATHDPSEEIAALVKKEGVKSLSKKPFDTDLLANFLTPQTPEVELPTGAIHHLGKLDEFLSQQEIKAQLQPIVDLRQGVAHLKTLGVESLARAATGSFLSRPEILFAYAAGKEQLFEMDMFCIRAAFKEISALKKPGKLFINVQPHSLINPKFVQEVEEFASDANFHPDGVVFELTEQQAILNLDAFANTLVHLRELGYGIALDDFGVGFANLHLVCDLKPDYIKLSGRFCRDIQFNQAKQVIVQSMAEMANRLQIPMIMENVETKEELETTLSLGVKYAQGFYFSAPRPAVELATSGWFDKFPAV